MDSGLTETTNTIIQLFPTEYQTLIATLVTVAVSIFGLVMFLMPFISKWSANKQVQAINDSALSQEDIAAALDSKLATFEKTRLIGEISNWKYKLIYANDETRPMIETEIARLESELSKYA